MHLVSRAPGVFSWIEIGGRVESVDVIWATVAWLSRGRFRVGMACGVIMLWWS